MKTIQELLQAARKAIEAGDLELAETIKRQAEMLKSVDALEPQEDTEAKALREQVAELEAFKTRIEAEPALNKAGVVVTHDETDKKAAQPWASLGEQLKAIEIAARYPHMVDDRIKAQKAILGANETVPSEGGFLVQKDFAAEIFSLMHDSGAVASRVRRIPIGANANGLKMNAIDETSRATGSRFGGVTGYWVAEGGTITASQPTFRQMELELRKVAAALYATDELLADTTALGAVMTQAAGQELAFMVDDALINGNGAGRPLGVLNAASLVSVAKETGQAATTLVADNLVKMWSRMWAGSRSNAVWFINQDVEPQLLTLDLPVGTGGVPVYLPPGGFSQAPYGTLFGRPVVPIEHCATLGTVGDVILADMSQYLMIDKGGVQAASSIHVQFLTDQQVFRFIYRVDGQPMWSSALTPASGSGNTLSPFVALATRS